VLSNGETIFTVIGFVGLYFVLGVLFLYLVGRQIGRGPGEDAVALDIARDQELIGIPRQEHFV
jgi:cytochrome d ubiquinol oxidase subunit I